MAERRRRRATQGDAGLVHKFGFGAVEQAFFVALEVFEAAQRNAAKGGDRCHLIVDCGGFGFEGRERFIKIEFVAALGFTGDGWTEIELFLQPAGQAKDVFDSAVQ